MLRSQDRRGFWMTDLLNKAQVISKAAVTYMTAAAIGLTAAADQIAKVGPDGAAHTVVMWLIIAATWLTAAVGIIRTHMPVPANQRGILPTAVPEPKLAPAPRTRANPRRG